MKVASALNRVAKQEEIMPDHPPHPHAASTLQYNRSRGTKEGTVRCGLLLAPLARCVDRASVEILRMVWWHGGAFCLGCGRKNISKYCHAKNTNIGTLIMTVTRHSPTKHAPSYTAGTSAPTDRWRAFLFLYDLVNNISMAQSHRRRAAPTRPPINEASHHGEYTRPSEVAGGCMRDRLGLCQGRRQRHAVGYKRLGPDHPQSLRPAHGPAVARSRMINRGLPHTFSRPQRTSQTSRS